MNKILGSVKKKCIFVIYRRAFFKLVKMTLDLIFYCYEKLRFVTCLYAISYSCICLVL